MRNKGSKRSEAWPRILQLALDLIATKAVLLTSTLFFLVRIPKLVEPKKGFECSVLYRSGVRPVRCSAPGPPGRTATRIPAAGGARLGWGDPWVWDYESMRENGL